MEREITTDTLWSLCRFGTRLLVELIQAQYLLPGFFRETFTVKSAAAIGGMQQVGQIGFSFRRVPKLDNFFQDMGKFFCKYLRVLVQ